MQAPYPAPRRKRAGREIAPSAGSRQARGRAPPRRVAWQSAMRCNPRTFFNSAGKLHDQRASPTSAHLCSGCLAPPLATSHRSQSPRHASLRAPEFTHVCVRVRGWEFALRCRKPATGDGSFS